MQFTEGRLRVVNRSYSGRVTIREVAAHAGVSVSAVSKVLRGAYGVSAPMRQGVEASVEALGFRPMASARGADEVRRRAADALNSSSTFALDWIGEATEALLGPGQRPVTRLSSPRRSGGKTMGDGFQTGSGC